VKGATDQQVEAYEIRQPWNPDPNTFAYVAQNTRFQCKGKAPTEEGIRKRFKAASLAVFKASGVYFEGNGIGLEAYGVPKKNSELKELIQQAATPTTAAATATPATSSSDRQSTGTPASSAQLASDAAGTGVSSSRPPAAVRRALRRARRAALRAIPRRDNRQDADEHRPKAFYTGQVVTVQLHSTSPIPAYRNADAKLIPKYDSLLREEVSETCHARPVVLTFIPELPFSPAAFDRWFATVFFGTRTSFPTQDFVCSEVAKDTYMIKEMARDREGEQVDIATVLETYILSTVLGTNTAASDMLFSELQSRIAAQSSGDEGPVPSNVHQRMQAYIEKDERLRDMNIEFQVADKREDDRSDDDVDDYDEHEPYRPTLKNFVDRPSNYKIPPFTDIWKDATVPKYDQISGAHQPSVEDDDDWYL
jgi:ribosomal protein L12E/L44/L45/RPP1/RPP2